MDQSSIALAQMKWELKKRDPLEISQFSFSSGSPLLHYMNNNKSPLTREICCYDSWQKCVVSLIKEGNKQLWTVVQESHSYDIDFALSSYYYKFGFV